MSPRPRKYATPEEAHAAKLAQAREKYRQSRIGVERKKWGFINTVITEDMVGKTIKELELEYRANHPSKTKAQTNVEEDVTENNNENTEEEAKADTEEE